MACPAAFTPFSLFLLIGCAAQSAAQAPPMASGDAPVAVPGELPAWLRPMVRTQMARQWAYVSELRWTAASLEFDRTRELARKIVHEVHFGRSADSSVPMDPVVPSGYLDLEEMLRERAFRLSLVADSGSTRLVSNAYHAMVEVCTKCHTAYRPGPPLQMPLISAH